MARLIKSIQKVVPAYRDRRFDGNQEEYEEALRRSTTVYVGNLSFFTTEEQIHELFSKCGEVKRIIVGLDKNKLTPCGFAFVEYYNRPDTERCVNSLSNTSLDERLIRIDIDWGFQEGRQYGRGRSGGQVRDEYRTFYDSGRGGYGKIVENELKKQMMSPGGVMEEEPSYSPATFNPKGHYSAGAKRRRDDDDEDEEMRDAYRDSYRRKDYRDDRKKSRTDNPRFRERGDQSDDDEEDRD